MLFNAVGHTLCTEKLTSNYFKATSSLLQSKLSSNVQYLKDHPKATEIC